ncbi:MAG: glycosyltransferase [Muribaculaceae bacterium]|nr:glycosyltransferase [Muribaculaceae bacterium]
MNKVKPEISIIVPVYNVAKYVTLCLESIAAQTFTDYECIVVDDGSTDGSGEACDRFAANHDKFQVIHQANQGLSEARNSGLALAQGKYIGFVDSDDYIHPDMYAILHEQIIATKSDLVSCLPQRVAQQDAPFEPNPPIECLVVDREQYFYLWFGTPAQKHQLDVVWNKLYTREIIGDINYVPGLQPGEDSDFNFRVSLRCQRLGLVNHVLYNWCARNGSLTSAHDDIAALHLSHKTFLANWNYLDYFDELTEREQGYVLNTLMRRTVLGIDKARRAGDKEKEAEFKHYQVLAEKRLMANNTVSFFNKTALYLIAHLSFLLPLAKKIHKFLMRRK